MKTSWVSSIDINDGRFSPVVHAAFIESPSVFQTGNDNMRMQCCQVVPFNSVKEIQMSKQAKSYLSALCVPFLLATAPVHAEETQCIGSLGAVALDNILVPDGASCMLTGTSAKGNIVVGRGATLWATRISVNGNIQAEGASSISVGGNSSVGGSVQVVQGLSASIERVRINGDLLLDENGGPLTAARNSIGGSLQAFQNTGGLMIAGNFIKGNLQCKENNPAPTGGGNRASSKEDQCARL
jgi:hypothetical protein